VPSRLPIQDMKDLAKKRGLRQVILAALDDEGRAHVVTYGRSVKDCDSAALSGENLKKLMGWPEWKTEPSRVRKLKDLLKKVRDAAVCPKKLADEIDEAIR
jgi:hypothetical protein